MSLSNLIPLLKSVIDQVSKFFLGLFIYNSGKDKVRLDSSEEELDDVKESKKLSSNIDMLDDDTLNSGLHKRKGKTTRD